MTESIYWYDLETTGTDSLRDRPLQFAGIRTDLNLEEVGEPQDVLCKPGDDILPDPEAIAVTGINMDEIVARGLNETEFAHSMLRQFTVPETCVSGFNSIRFDDEFTRQMLYRNFHDPYSREWRSGNSRWDVIDLVRTAYALRPEGINWPMREDGAPSFRLEDLTAANEITHVGAHDALADVRATIDVVRMIRQVQPRLYEYLFRLREKKAVIAQLYPLGKSAVVHVSSMYPASRGCASIVLPLCQHPRNGNGVICFDLGTDPAQLMDVTPDELHRLVFTRSDELEEGDERVALKTIHINRCPSVAPIGTLDDVAASRLGIDKSACLAHMEQLQRASGIVEKIQDAFTAQRFDSPDDPDLMLYSGGFFSDTDRNLMNEIHQSEPRQLQRFEGGFQDDRLDEMLFRFRARNFPGLLEAAEQSRWEAYKQDLWQETGRVEDVRTRLAAKLSSADLNEKDRTVLDALSRYFESIGA